MEVLVHSAAAAIGFVVVAGLVIAVVECVLRSHSPPVERCLVQRLVLLRVGCLGGGVPRLDARDTCDDLVLREAPQQVATPRLSLVVPLEVILPTAVVWDVRALELELKLKEGELAVILLVDVNFEKFAESADVDAIHAGLARVQSDSASDAYPSSEVDAEAEAVEDCNYLVRHSLRTKSR